MCISRCSLQNCYRLQRIEFEKMWRAVARLSPTKGVLEHLQSLRNSYTEMLVRPGLPASSSLQAPSDAVQKAQKRAEELATVLPEPGKTAHHIGRIPMNLYPVPVLSVFKYGKIYGVGGVKEPAVIRKHLESVRACHHKDYRWKEKFIPGNRTFLNSFLSSER